MKTIASIPRGRVANYGQIAALAGCKGRARLVGTVLRNTPDDVVLPWHRVLRADGRIAFPAGSASFEEQRRRLAGEGVDVVRGRVDLGRHGWRRNLDEVLWDPRAFVGAAAAAALKKNNVSAAGRRSLPLSLRERARGEGTNLRVHSEVAAAAAPTTAFRRDDAKKSKEGPARSRKRNPG